MIPQWSRGNWSSHKQELPDVFGAPFSSAAASWRPHLDDDSTSPWHRDTCFTAGIHPPSPTACTHKPVSGTCKVSTPIKNDSSLRIGPHPPELALIYSRKLDAGELWHAGAVIQEMRTRFWIWGALWRTWYLSARTKHGPLDAEWQNREGQGLLCAVFTLDSYSFISTE